MRRDPLVWKAWASGIPKLVWRTAREDATLRSGLPGYAEYARQVKYRLVPGVW
jgi:protein-S-isoprenylcysteine O-methyltransferase Ste14